MKKHFWFYLVTMVLVGCIKELPLESDVYVEPKPVFHLFIQPDSTLIADFSKVTSITAPSVTTDNGLISLFRNNAFEGDMPPIGNGRYYWQNNQFKPRDSFRIYGSDGLYSFFVRGRVPSEIKITKLDTQTILIPGIGPSFAVDVSFTDSAIDDNFYRLYLRKYYFEYKLDAQGKRTDSTLKNRIVEIKGSELPFIQNNFNNYTSSEIIFSDATFNGTKAKFRVHSPGRMWETAEIRNVKMEVILENLEKPLFDFYNTRNAHLWQQQSISQLPGNINGNISAGFGIGAAFTREVKEIAFP